MRGKPGWRFADLPDARLRAQCELNLGRHLARILQSGLEWLYIAVVLTFSSRFVRSFCARQCVNAKMSWLRGAINKVRRRSG